VTVVPRGNAEALASATIAALSRGNRTDAATAEVIAREFAPRIVAERYYRLYETVMTAGTGRRTVAPGSVT
jgi:hypothetical protein